MAAAPSVEEALAFVAEANAELKDVAIESDRAAWVNATYITDDTDWLATRATDRALEVKRRLIDAARRFEGLELPPAAARQLKLLRLSATLPAPADANARRQLAEIRTAMSSAYGKGKICLQGNSECFDLNKASKILATERDYDTLLAVWQGWRKIAVPMREPYARFVEISNQGAREIGFADTGELWRSGYDLPPQAFEAEVERLWQQVKPLYDSLHCYVRARLSDHYGADKVPRRGPIPAHLLGNMWAQEWATIYPLVEPYPGQVSLDVTQRLVSAKWDPKRMVKTGEAFFTSLGMQPLPETFWQRSMFTKPRDREVMCHASAWDMGGIYDPRIKMCIQVNEEDLNTIHHELGHVYYFLHYADQPTLFQRGAHDGFHEGIGDTLVLSVTSSYLQKLKLLDGVPKNPKAEINTLMKRALDKVAFLPFGKMMDQWRWRVFDGRISKDGYNQGWWRLRQQVQGVVAPSERSESDFDPGAKFHIAANVPYVRYFLAHILQFQFHRALCQAAGHRGPLHTCSIYDNQAAGDKLAALLSLGQSKPWPDALEKVTGERQMDASAVLDYFAPLQAYLDNANQDEQCGW